MRLRRSDVYICNVVKCRPQNQVQTRRGGRLRVVLARQIEIVAPK
jgi:uracil-DNA glycosylase